MNSEKYSPLLRHKPDEFLHHFITVVQIWTYKNQPETKQQSKQVCFSGRIGAQRIQDKYIIQQRYGGDGFLICTRCVWQSTKWTVPRLGKSCKHPVRLFILQNLLIFSAEKKSRSKDKQIFIKNVPATWTIVNNRSLKGNILVIAQNFSNEIRAPLLTKSWSIMTWRFIQRNTQF